MKWLRPTASRIGISDRDLVGVENEVGQACGIATRKAGEVCVSATLKGSLSGSECTSVQKAGPRRFGLVQTSNDADQKTLSYRLP